jgi:cob(I)alamin adenosyltransferase
VVVSCGPVRREVLALMNRASDLLFVLSRRANALAGVDDAPWRPKG